MRRSAIFVSLAAAVVFAAQPAKAEDLLFLSRHPKVDMRVATTSLGIGLASTGVYFAVKDGHGVDWGAYGATTAGCMVLGPMIAAALIPERELTSREVLVMQGSCLIPIVGGILVNALFDANPHWEAQPVRRVSARR
jgi:hypothetical protein